LKRDFKMELKRRGSEKKFKKDDELDGLDDNEIEAKLQAIRLNIASKNVELAKSLEKYEDLEVMEELSKISEIEAIRRRRILQRERERRSVAMEKPIQKLGLSFSEKLPKKLEPKPDVWRDIFATEYQKLQGSKSDLKAQDSKDNILNEDSSDTLKSGTLRETLSSTSDEDDDKEKKEKKENKEKDGKDHHPEQGHKHENGKAADHALHENGAHKETEKKPEENGNESVETEEDKEMEKRLEEMKAALFKNHSQLKLIFNENEKDVELLESIVMLHRYNSIQRLRKETANFRSLRDQMNNNN